MRNSKTDSKSLSQYKMMQYLPGEEILGQTSIRLICSIFVLLTLKNHVKS